MIQGSNMLSFSFNPIATHTTLDGTFNFFEKTGSEKIYAEVPNQVGFFPVSISPKVRTEALAYLSSAAKVKRLLQGFFVQPTYQAETHAVTLEPSSPEIEAWKRKAMLRLPPDAISICRADGKISYAIGDTVTTWDWATDTYEVIEVKNAAGITALAERSDGSLIMGDEKGQLHVAGKIINTGIQQSITDILYFHDAWALIKYEKISENERREIEIKKLNFLTGEVGEVDRQTQILALGDGSLIILDKTKDSICWEQFDQTQRKFIDIPTRDKKEKIFAIRLASKTKVLLLHKDNKELLTMYDIETHTEQTWKNDQLWIDCLRNYPYVCLDDQTIAVGSSVGRNALINFYYREGLEKEPMNAPEAGSWGVNAMITLSNGSIMYGTHTTPSGIHLVDIEGKIAFTHTFSNENPQIKSLTELPNGAIAIKSYDSIIIMQPQLKDNSPLSDNESKYNTYISSLEAAFKQANFYKARRYYEKAKKIKPSSNAHSLISLLHLKKSLNKKLYRQVLLDTLYGQNNEKVKDIHLDQEVSTWKTKTCKKRLFIGEGTFTFTEAFIKKHEETHSLLASSIVATELAVPSEKKEEVMQRVSHLRERGVTVLFGIDGQLLHNHFREKRFKRIHWNCPFTGTGVSQDIFKAAIPQFFLSCAQLQLSGDRVHIALMQEKSRNYWKKRQTENPIVLGATSAGYRLIRKRLFGTKRYPGYQHAKTSGEDHSKGEQREFVFEKAHPPSAKAESEFLACNKSLDNEFLNAAKKLESFLESYILELQEVFHKNVEDIKNISETSKLSKADLLNKAKDLEEKFSVSLSSIKDDLLKGLKEVKSNSSAALKSRLPQEIQKVVKARIKELKKLFLDNVEKFGIDYLNHAKNSVIAWASINENLKNFSKEKVQASRDKFLNLSKSLKLPSSYEKNSLENLFLEKVKKVTTEFSNRQEQRKLLALKILKKTEVTSLAYINALMDPDKKKFAIKIFKDSNTRNRQLGQPDKLNFTSQDCYYECSSDEDSSDCYDSD